MNRLLSLFFALLLVRTAVAAPVPDGFLFEKNDHFLTPSESLFFTYALEKGDEAELRNGIEFRIDDLAGNTVAEGEAAGFERRGCLAVFRLLTPEQSAQLKPGWHTLAVRIAGGEAGNDFFRMKFYVRGGEFARRVVYLLDCVTPEGFAFWLNGRGQLIEPLRDFPEQGRPDCVVVSSFTPLPEKTLGELKRFVQSGGTALFFGVNHSRLDELNPLKLNRADLYPQSPKKSADGSLVYLLNAELADGAELLKAAGDGSPEIAVKPFGKGRVVAYAGGLKPGAGYDRMIYPYGLGIQVDPTPPERFRAAAPDAGGFREGISRNNFGRFGWLNDDRINAIGLQPDQTFRMWDVDRDSFGVSFSGSHTPGKLAALETGWLGKSMLGTGGRWGQGTEIVWGLGTPGVLLRNPDADKVSIESPMPATLAYPVKGGTRAISLEPGAMVDLKGLSSNWFLVWKRTDKYDAWPLLFTFSRKISAARMNGKYLEIDFAKRGVDLAVMPLAGIKHYTPAETAGWEQALPADIAARCARWSRIQAARTVGCIERYKLDKKNGTVLIRNDFDYLVIPNDWGVEPEYVAPVPPLLPLYAKSGNVKFADGTADLDYATLQGPLHGVSGKRSEYTLAIPEVDYPLPVTAADPHLELPVNKVLFERITEHLAEPGLSYIPSDYGIVERREKTVYPERELREATSMKPGPEAAEWNYIDLHRTLGGVAGNLMFKPYLDGVRGYGDTRARLNAKIARNIRRDIEFFQYKTFLRYRQEPFTGAWYLMAFIAPVRFNDGYWMFHDMNETAGIFLQTLGLYSRIMGDPVFFASNEPYIDLFMSNLLVSHDWAWMGSSAVEWGMGNNIDMLNAELSGCAGMVRIKESLGRTDEADFGRYMAAKAGASTGARLLMSDFYNSLNFPVPAHLEPVIHEMAGAGQAESGKGRYLPLGVAQGYGEGWPSLWPTAVTPGLLKHFFDGKDFYSTSKGVPAELLAFYRSNEALAGPLREFEAKFREAAYRERAPYLYSRIAGNAGLKSPYDRADLERMLLRTLSMPGCSAQSLGAGTADWETTAMVILLDLLARNAGEIPAAGIAPAAGREKDDAAGWEVTGDGSGHAVIWSVDEPENVADGPASACLDLAAASGGKTSAAFFRFDRQAIRENGFRAVSFLVKSETPGMLRLVLPDRDWTREAAAVLPIDGETKTWKRVRLELERDFKMKASGIAPENLRGELFLYNSGATPVRIYIDGFRFEP